MELAKRVCHVLGLVNHKGINGTGRVGIMLLELHHVSQTTHTAGKKNVTLTAFGVASHITSNAVTKHAIKLQNKS